MIDPTTQLAFGIFESKGVYALLVGSGISRAAEIPTGWEITTDLVRRVALAQGIPEQSDWPGWYRTASGEEPNYSKLLEGLGASPDERRAILHRYIEPTRQDREAGSKLPTLAHFAIADLVAAGYIRVIITTNFDRLLESALRDRGVEPTVISSVDALRGAEPMAHSACYLLKLHGDYKDARILNTEAELGAYPKEYDALLDRIFDEYGLIVCGWSGEWDSALRSALLRAPNRRYPMFWAARGPIGSGAEAIIASRRGRAISISDANSFFSSLQSRVEILDQTQRQNPVSIELLVNSAKRYVAKPEYRIQLDALMHEELDKLIAILDGPDLVPPGSWGAAEFKTYAARYEAATEALATICGALGRWGDGSEQATVQDTLCCLRSHAAKVGSGVVSYIGMRSYPAVLVFTAYGVALTRAERWGALHQLLSMPIERDHQGRPIRAVDAIFLNGWDGGDRDMWRQLEGFERRTTPLSDHLLTIFKDWGSRFLGLTPDLEEVYERFEILGSLVFLETESKKDIQESLTNGGQNDWTWMPVGRAGWRDHHRRLVLADIASERGKQTFLPAGFAKGDPDFIDLFIRNFRAIAGRMRFN